MARYAMVKDKIVFNIAEWDGETEWNPDCDIVECPDDYTGVGWSWDGKKFTPPKEA